MHRRDFLKFSLGGLSLLAFGGLRATRALAAAAVEKLNLSKEEWKKRLTDQQFDILREAGTERPFSSKMNDEHREGTFACVGCGLDLFLSRFKFDSGTGWPSFYDMIPGHLETTTDYKLIVPRTEYHCARCGGHHGHVFEDGPKPTGLRYCSNGAVLTFKPKA